MTASNRLKVAVVQMNSKDDKAANVATALGLIDCAAASGARFVALPEVWTYLGPDEGNYANAEPIPGPTSRLLAERARRHGIFLHAGSMLERAGPDGQLLNTTVVFDPSGAEIGRYSKIHMFDVVLGDAEAYKESDTVTPGDAITVVDVDGWKVGLAICYDLRFPELHRILALRGAEAIVLPAAFTLTTGKDHWETLIRARAIENGVYLIAPAQVGQHPAAQRPSNGASANGREQRRSPDPSWPWCYGRSMIVDPWGTIVATAPDTEGVIVAELAKERINRVRQQIPSLANRRPEAYTWPKAEKALSEVGD